MCVYAYLRLSNIIFRFYSEQKDADNFPEFWQKLGSKGVRWPLVLPQKTNALTHEFTFYHTCACTHNNFRWKHILSHGRFVSKGARAICQLLPTHYHMLSHMHITTTVTRILLNTRTRILAFTLYFAYTTGSLQYSVVHERAHILHDTYAYSSKSRTRIFFHSRDILPLALTFDLFRISPALPLLVMIWKRSECTKLLESSIMFVCACQFKNINIATACTIWFFRTHTHTHDMYAHARAHTSTSKHMCNCIYVCTE